MVRRIRNPRKAKITKNKGLKKDDISSHHGKKQNQCDQALNVGCPRLRERVGNSGRKGREEGKKGLKKPPNLKSQRIQVKVCNVCGNRGFSNALISCSKCSDTLAHQYCIGIIPGSIDDTFIWVCECCSASVVSKSRTSCGVAFTKRTKNSHRDQHARALETKNKSEITLGVDEAKPLCILPPLLYHGSSEQTDARNQSQVAEGILRTPSTFSGHSSSYREKHDDASVSSFMDYPEAFMCESVLLVSPSGEIIFCQGMSCFDGSLSQVAEGAEGSQRICNSNTKC